MDSAPRQSVFLHVDMDAFFAAIAVRDDPSLAGKPVVIGSPPNRRGVVSTASYEARRYGIHSAMPSSEAFRLCPHAVFLPPDMPRYEAVSADMFRIFDRYTPFVLPLSIDEAFLEVSGGRRLFGDAPSIARRIKEDIRSELRLTCSVGVAPNPFLAKLGSELEKPDGLTILPFDPPAIAAFLRPLPVSRIWGVGRVTRQSLERTGVHSIGQLQDMPLSSLKAVVGESSALHLKELAVGRDPRSLQWDFREKSFSREYTFPQDVQSRRVLSDTLFPLVEDVAARLREDGRLATTARLKIRWASFQTQTRQQPFPAPTRLGRDLHAAADALLRSLSLSKPVRLIGFGVSGLLAPAAPAAQGELFADPPDLSRRRTESLERTADGIRRDHGPSSLRLARELLPPSPPPVRS
jgi:DNA polymerase-4